MAAIVMISFFVAGIPKAAPRPRKGKHGNFYVPDVDAAWKEAIGWRGKVALRGKRSTGAVILELQFHMPTPKANRLLCGTPHTSKPDIDNLTKSAMDALTKIQAWNDDSQVSKLTSSKTYASTPGLTVTIEGVL